MIAEVIGLGEACRIFDEIGLDEIGSYENMLAKKAIELLSQIEDVEIYNKIQIQGLSPLILREFILMMRLAFMIKIMFVLEQGIIVLSL